MIRRVRKLKMISESGTPLANKYPPSRLIVSRDIDAMCNVLFLCQSFGTVPSENGGDTHVDEDLELLPRLVCRLVVVQVKMVDAQQIVVPDPFFDIVLGIIAWLITVIIRFAFEKNTPPRS
jgi:hypothetical protein